MSGSIVFTVIILSTVLLAQACPSIQSAITPDLVIGLGALVEADLDPDGHFISTLSEYALHLWYLNGSLASVYPSVEGVPFTGHAWSPHGSMIAVSDYRGRICVVRVPELSIVAELDYEYGSFTGVACDLGVHPWPVKWSQDGSLIGLGWCNEKCYVYNLSNKALQIWVGQKDSWEEVEAFDWSPNSEMIAMGTWDKSSIYSLTSSPIFQEDRDGYSVDFINTSLYEIQGRLPTFSPNGSLIAVLGDKSLELHSAVNGSLCFSIDIVSSISSLAWFPDGDLLALGSQDGEISVLDIVEKKIVSNTSAHTSSITSLSWEGLRLASTSTDQTVKIWSLDTNSGRIERIRTFSGWDTGVRTALWFPDDNRIAAAYNRGGPLKVYELGGSEELRIDLPPGSGELREGAVSPDGRMIAAVTEEGGISIWDAQFGTLSTLHDVSDVLSLRWNPKQPGIIALVGRGGVKIMDGLNPQRGVLSEIIIDGFVFCVDWSPPGEMLAIGLLSRIEVWDPWRPTLLASEPDWRWPCSIAWSPDGSKLAYLAGFQWTYDKEELPPEYIALPDIARIRVWEVSRASESQLSLHHVDDTYLPRTGDVSLSWDLAWAPNSTMLCAGTGPSVSKSRSFEHSGLPGKPCVMIWRVEAGGLIPAPVLNGPTRWVTSVDWSPDGSKIMAGSNDGMIWIWKVGPEGVINEPFTYLTGLAVIFLAFSLRNNTHANHIQPCLNLSPRKTRTFESA